MATFCEQCGAALPPGAHFCEMCGHPVPDSSEPAATGEAVGTSAELSSGRDSWAPVSAEVLGEVPPPRHHSRGDSAPDRQPRPAPLVRQPAAPDESARPPRPLPGAEPVASVPREDLPPAPRRRRWIGPAALVGLLLVAAAFWMLRDGGAPDRPYYLETPLFADDFSDPRSGWEVWTNERSSAQYEGGQFHLRQSASGVMAVSRAFRTFEDLALQVDAAPLALPAGSSYGVFVGFDGSDTYGMLEVSDEGDYRIVSVRDGAADLVADWTPLPALHEGEMTRLLALRDGGALTFSLNGRPLPEFIADYVPGDLALFVSKADGAGAGDVHVAFDDLKVWVP